MTAKRFTYQQLVNGQFSVDDNEEIYGEINTFHHRIADVNSEKQAKRVCDLLNALHEENTRLQSDLAMTIDSKSKEIRSLKEDVTILQKALWCSGCENDYDRLRQLRKGFLE